MIRHLQRILFLMLVIEAWTRTEAASKTFPNIAAIGDEFWQAEVQLTDQTVDATSFATEYYDLADKRGRLDVIVYGEKLSVFYYNLTGDILEVNKTSCIASPEAESDYFYLEMFHGWLYKYPLVIGPSALLWYAQDFKPDYVGVRTVRGIECDYYELSVKDKIETMTYGFYFAAEDWTMPYQLKKHSIPVRITAEGESARESEDKTQLVDVDQIIDYSYMRSIDDFQVFQPDIGLGCFGRSTEMVFPKIPKEFRFSAESYNLLKAENDVATEALYMKMFFSNYSQLARLDRYTSNSMKSDLYDFKNGVSYSIENGVTCKVKPMRESFFEDYDGLNGKIKTPEEVLMLSGDFYYMGEGETRGIQCRVFESARRHVDLNYVNYYLLVTTVFFTSQSTKVGTEGETMIDVPVYIMITAYEKPSEVSVKLQYNIFGFDDVVGPTLFEDFPLADCFPSPDQKAYFVLNSPVNIDVARTMEANNQLVVDMVKSQIMRKTGISFIRIPFIKADYHPSGVDISGLMLDKPAAINQFWMLFYGPAKADVTQVKANTKEKCADQCISTTEFDCRGFHFCGGYCFLNEVDINEDMPEAGKRDLGICELYIRALMTSSHNEPNLPTALESLSKAVIDVDIPVGNGSLQVRFPDIIIGDGVFNRDVSDKSYSLVFHGMQLPSEDVSTTTKSVKEISNENDCYRACKADTTLDCQSFSYCPGSSDVQCRISQLVVSQDMTIKSGDLENKQGCVLYSLLNLDYYTPYPGRVSMIPSDDSYEKISVQECSLKCKNKKGVGCRGFDYCRTGRTCILHSKHVLDYKEGQLVNTKEKCTHYAAKFVADYQNMGFTLIDDDNNKRTEITLEACAKACSEELPECKSFNYCPDTNEYSRDSSCSFHRMTLGQAKKVIEKRPCRLYSKRDAVENYGSKQTMKPNDDGYTKGGFAGVVIGTLIFGVIIGAAAFVGYSFYRSRKYNDGMSVRFMKGES